MATSRQSNAGRPSRPSDEVFPDVFVCRSCPEKSVFIEAGNTDGWIATDSAVELAQ